MVQRIHWCHIKEEGWEILMATEKKMLILLHMLIFKNVLFFFTIYIFSRRSEIILR
jgi:hypothetical protein